MLTLADDSSPDQIDLHLRHLIIRLTGRPEAADVRTEAQRVLDELRAAHSAWRAAHDDSVCATAEVGYRDEMVDQALAALVTRLEDLVDGDRTDPRFLAAFPTTPSAAMSEVATDAQHAYVNSALSILAGDPDAPILAPRIDALRMAQQALMAAITDRSHLNTTESTANARLRVAARAARDFHNAASARLTVAFPRQKALVRSFFRR